MHSQVALDPSPVDLVRSLGNAHDTQLLTLRARANRRLRKPTGSYLSSQKKQGIGSDDAGSANSKLLVSSLLTITIDTNALQPLMQIFQSPVFVIAVQLLRLSGLYHNEAERYHASITIRRHSPTLSPQHVYFLSSAHVLTSPPDYPQRRGLSQTRCQFLPASVHEFLGIETKLKRCQQDFLLITLFSAAYRWAIVRR